MVMREEDHTHGILTTYLQLVIFIAYIAYPTATSPFEQGALEGVGSPREESVKLLVLALCPEGFVRPPESTSVGKVHP